MLPVNLAIGTHLLFVLSLHQLHYAYQGGPFCLRVCVWCFIIVWFCEYNNNLISFILFGTCMCPGTVFDMRGKRFLDVKVVPLPPKVSADGKDGTPDTQARPVSPVRSGSMWSLNTKRLFGSSSSQASHSNGHSGSAASSAVNSPASPVPAPKDLDPVAQLAVTKKKILFVQDVKTLIIVACDRGDSKSSKLLQ